MIELEIVGVRCPECEQMVSVNENHACWSQEVGMREFENAMWKKWKQENMIEPYVLPNVYYCWIDEPGHTGGWFCVHPECLVPDLEDES